VTTLAGVAGQVGWINGTGNTALFTSPKAMSVDADGNVYTVDSFCGTIREISPKGVTATIAGPTWGCEFGAVDGPHGAARFTAPSGTAVDSRGVVYVADSGSCLIRRIAIDGTVTTVAGAPYECVAVDGPKGVGRLNPPAGIAVDKFDTVWFTSWGDCTVRKVTADGEVSTVAGIPYVCATKDGARDSARFNNPSGIAIGGEGNFYIADETGCTVRKMTPSGVVSTLAGEPDHCGSSDGFRSEAHFSVPSWTAVDQQNNVYVSDYLNATIRMVAPDGRVTTIAGLSGSVGSADGTGANARFNHPDGIAVDRNGVIYVADRNNQIVRRIVLDSKQAAGKN
jgi:sugar lactone lactonase YvrE